MTHHTHGRANAPIVPLADKRQWSVKEFAALFGISVPTIYRYAQRGEIKLLKSSSWRRTFITREEAERWQASLAANAKDYDEATVANDRTAPGTAA